MGDSQLPSRTCSRASCLPISPTPQEAIDMEPEETAFRAQASSAARQTSPASLTPPPATAGGGGGEGGGCCSLLDAAHCSLNVAWPLQGPLQPEGTDCLLFRVSLTSRSRLGIELGLQTAEPLSKAWHSAPPGRGEQAGVRLDPQELSKAERQRKQWAGSRSWCGHRPLCTVKGCPSGPSNRPECQSKPVTL